jgi:hypothetical protein
MGEAKEQVTWEKILQMTEQFYEDPSAENYLAIRRLVSRYDIVASHFSVVDWPDTLGLEGSGLDPSLLSAALSGDEHIMDDLCIKLLEGLIERKQLAANGETHLASRSEAISDALINHLIVSMLEVLQEYDLAPRQSLILLVRDRLGGPQTAIMKNAGKRAGRQRALWLAFQMRRKGEQPTIRAIAKKMDVEPSTISRWFEGENFGERVEIFANQFVSFPPEQS